MSWHPNETYTQLYVDTHELEIVPYITVEWTSLLRRQIVIDRISFRFMSHMNQRSVLLSIE